MFPINAAFYIPMFYYTPQPYLVSNPQFLYPDMNIFTQTQNSFDSLTSLTVTSQIERKADIENDNSELYVPDKNEEKCKDFMKKKLIRKRFQKCVDSVEEAQRLKRKLANRPKTYQTQKKMYLNANLDEFDQHDEGKRTLRKRPEKRKKEKILQQTSSKCEIEQIFNNGEYIQKLDEMENQVSSIKAIKKIKRNQNFYNPQAEMPKPYAETSQLNLEIGRKKLSLLSRKIEAKLISLQ